MDVSPLGAGAVLTGSAVVASAVALAAALTGSAAGAATSLGEGSADRLSAERSTVVTVSANAVVAVALRGSAEDDGASAVLRARIAGVALRREGLADASALGAGPTLTGSAADEDVSAATGVVSGTDSTALGAGIRSAEREVGSAIALGAGAAASAVAR